MTRVDWIANAMPWAGSLIPSVMTFQNVQKLGFEPWQAVIIGAVVEGIGFVFIDTAINVYEANQAEIDAKLGNMKRSLFDVSFWIAVTGAAVYLLAVLMVNAILDSGDIWRKITLGLLSLFGVLGGVAVALRNQLWKRLLKIERLGQENQAERAKAEAQALEREREERAFAHHLEEEKLRQAHETEIKKIEEDSRRKIEKIHADSARKVTEQSPVGAGQSQQVPGDNAVTISRWPDVPDSDWEWVRDAPAIEIVKKYRIQGKDRERKARKWKEYAKEAIERRGTK